MLHSKKEILIFGKHPFFIALASKKRKVFSIYVSQKNKNEFLETLGKENIKIDNRLVNFVSNEKLDSIFPYNEKNHQGYILFAGEKKLTPFNDFYPALKNKNDLPKLLILDQVSDPHNLGAIIRTAVAFDINNLIVTAMNSVRDTSVVVKSSAGLSEFINLIEVQNLNSAIQDLKKAGYFIIGLDGSAKNTIDRIGDGKNIALVLGSEGRGIRELVRKNCDDLVKIPMSKNAESLNVSVAAAISMYELWGKNE